MHTTMQILEFEQTVKGVVDRQKQYFNSNVTKSFEWRVQELDLLARMLSENENAFYDAVSKDFKTALPEKVFEVAGTLGTIEATKSQLKSWMEPVQVPVPQFLAASKHRALVYREPYGVALILGPFNAPLLNLLRPAITALAAGNTCILKVPETPATGALLLELIPRYFEPEAVFALSGSREEIEQLLHLPFDFIYFTGSTRVGKIVMRAAADNLIPVVLELGGQNPAIVDETANLPDAAKKLVWGATAWGGQWCTSPGYAYVHESVADEFASECKKAAIELYGLDPKNNLDFSRIINPRAVERLAALIDPDKVIVGGECDPNQRYVAPTVMYPVSWSDKIMEEEIFGPILPILTYTTLDEAITQIKGRPKPLCGFIFSRNEAAIAEFLRVLSFGGGAVNQTNIHLFIGTMPFGGVGNSGMGYGNGKYGFDALTHAKAMLWSPPDVAIEHLFPPYDIEKVQALSQWRQY